MDASKLGAFVARKWDDDLLPELIDYVRVPAKSPAFDAQWAEHGYLASVITAAERWCRAQPVAGLVVDVVRIDGLTPCLFFEAPATGGRDADPTVLFYGHLDKQPEMTGWREDLGPWTPVLENGRLYGRGGADDGYAVYAALTAIQALDAQGVARPRCVGLIETCEESGSIHLPAYLERLAPRMGRVGFVVGLDSGCGNYEQLWVTNSLRGLVSGVLTVDVLSEGVHSGAASGLVPSSFRIARRLLDRIDDPATGVIALPDMHTSVPDDRMAQVRAAADILGENIWRQFPWVDCAHAGAGAPAHAMPTSTDPVEALLNRTWRPALSITGAAGLPSVDAAGNVLRPKTAFKLSIRIPPTVDAERATRALTLALENDPPYGARVHFKADHGATGWNAPATVPWLAAALDEASMQAFGKPAAWIGEGGTIPFMNMLGSKFPQAQFLITGVLGPKSNAHGPNEFLDVAYAKRLTTAVATIVARVQG